MSPGYAAKIRERAPFRESQRFLGADTHNQWNPAAFRVDET